MAPIASLTPGNFGHYLRVGFYCTGFIILLTSCSIFSSAPSSSVQIARSTEEIPQGWDFELISNDPYVYRHFAGDEQGNPPVYMTVIRDCSFDQEKVSGPALTRQLFVGLQELRVMKRSMLEVGSREVLWWLLQANLDEQMISLSTFSVHDGSCAVDFVLWAPAPGDREDQSLLDFRDRLESFPVFLSTVMNDALAGQFSLE